jgi:hypothetical protein
MAKGKVIRLAEPKISKPTLRIDNKFLPIGKTINVMVKGKVIRVVNDNYEKGSTVEVNKITHKNEKKK